MALFTSDTKKKTTAEIETRSRLRDALSSVDDEQAPDVIPMPSVKATVVVSDPIPAKPVAGQVVDVNRRLAGLARSIKSHQRKATEELLKCGQALAEAQSLLANHKGGTFSKWLKDKCDMGRTTAYRIIGIYEKFGGCPNAGRLADTDALRRLSGGPATAILKATKMLDDGQRVDLKTAKQLITDASPKKPKPETVVQHLEVPGVGMIVIRSATKVDPKRALLAALNLLRKDEPKAA